MAFPYPPDPFVRRPALRISGISDGAFQCPAVLCSWKSRPAGASFRRAGSPRAGGRAESGWDGGVGAGPVAERAGGFPTISPGGTLSIHGGGDVASGLPAGSTAAMEPTALWSGGRCVYRPRAAAIHRRWAGSGPSGFLGFPVVDPPFSPALFLTWTSALSRAPVDHPGRPDAGDQRVSLLRAGD